jgi:hypothetical protein
VGKQRPSLSYQSVSDARYHVDKRIEARSWVNRASKHAILVSRHEEQGRRRRVASGQPEGAIGTYEPGGARLGSLLELLREPRARIGV